MAFHTSHRTVGKNRGFTLIEALVAISILLLAVTAPLMSAFIGITSTDLVRDRTVASFLAEDAAEYVITYKDQNALEGNVWLNGFDSCDKPNSWCQIDTLENTIQACPNTGVCQLLGINQTTGQYGYGSGANWQQTKFTRSVHIDSKAGKPSLGDDEALVTIDVTWKSSSGKTNTVEIKVNIFNIPV
jgi:prepilin-type N-terminal cleavage/methylation domain-containing protein